MAADLVTAGLGILSSIGGGIARHQSLMKQRARPRFESTEYGKELARLKSQGAISQQQRAEMMGRVGAETGAVASQGKADYRGRLYSQGMGGSMAGQRGINQFDITRMGEMGKTSRDIDMRNEESKQRAAEMYSKIGTEWDEQRRQEQRQIDAARKENITSSIVGAIPYVGGIAQQFLPKSKEELAEKDWKEKERNMMYDLSQQKLQVGQAAEAREMENLGLEKKKIISGIYMDENRLNLDRYKAEIAAGGNKLENALTEIIMSNDDLVEVKKLIKEELEKYRQKKLGLSMPEVVGEEY